MNKKIDENNNIVNVNEPSALSVSINGINNNITVNNSPQSINSRILINGNNNKILIGKCTIKSFSIVIGSHRRVSGVKLIVGDNFSIEPGGIFEIFTDLAEIRFGEKCMLSRNITLHYGENPHLIFDKSTATYRDGKGGISVGAHVWIGEGAYLSKNAQIPQESIVAARSVVSRSFSQPHILIGGNPAKVLREDIQWFRNRHHIPPGSSFDASIAEYDAHVLRSDSQRMDKIENNTISENRVACNLKINNNINSINNTTLLFCIGAMKAGTTWLYDYLKLNSDVYFRDVKEIHYFDVIKLKSEATHLKRRAAQLKRAVQKLQDGSIHDINNHLNHIDSIIKLLNIYRKPYNNHKNYIEYLNSGNNGQKIIGDITPSYSSLDADAFREMSMIAQDVKFIFIIRDPIQRLWSAIRMRAREISSDKNSIDAACKKIVEELFASISNGNPHHMLKRSDYKSTIENLDISVPGRDVLYVFYEDLFTEAGTKDICDFLCINHHAPDITRKVNVGVSVDISENTALMLRSLLANQYEFLSARFGERAYKLD